MNRILKEDLSLSLSLSLSVNDEIRKFTSLSILKSQLYS